MNGALKLANGGFHALGDLVTRMDNAAATFDAPNVEVYAAADSASALRALDEWNVDMNSVTARVDEFGNDVLESPGGKIEMPAGSFENAAGDGGADAAVTAPVREPELVAAGGVRGETGPGAVNTIVDDAPVRTETGGGSVAGDGISTAGGGVGHGSSGGGGIAPDDGNGHGGTPSMDQQIARLDGHGAVLDTSGRDISSSLQTTTMSVEELAAYLHSTDSAAFDDYIATGEWPGDVQIPKSLEVLDVGVDEKFGVDWSEVPQRGYVVDDFGNAIKNPFVPPIGSTPPGMVRRTAHSHHRSPTPVRLCTTSGLCPLSRIRVTITSTRSRAI